MKPGGDGRVDIPSYHSSPISNQPIDNNNNNNNNIYIGCWEGEVVYLVSEIVYFNIIFIFYIDMSNNFIVTCLILLHSC